MLNKSAHILIDLHEDKFLLFFKQPLDKEVIKELVQEFKEQNRDKQEERYLRDGFLDFLHEKGYKDADSVSFGVTIDLHDYYKNKKE